MDDLERLTDVYCYLDEAEDDTEDARITIGRLRDVEASCRPDEPSRWALIHFHGWFGRDSVQVEYIDSTPKRHRVRLMTDTRLPGRCRKGRAGDEILVPKRAVTFLGKDNCSVCGGDRGGVPGNENVIDGALMCDFCSADRLPQVCTTAQAVHESSHTKSAPSSIPKETT